MQRTTKGTPVFEVTDIGELDGGEFWFECSMISTCKPIFDDCDGNYEVEQKLQAAGVITQNDQTDSESCALVVNFTDFNMAENFLARLNRYLVEHGADAVD